MKFNENNEANRILPGFQEVFLEQKILVMVLES